MKWLSRLWKNGAAPTEEEQEAVKEAVAKNRKAVAELADAALAYLHKKEASSEDTN